MVHASAKFWWTSPPDKASDGNGSRGPHNAEGLTKIFLCFLVMERHGYFGPSGQAPREHGLPRLLTKEKKKYCFQVHCKGFQAGIYINRTNFKCSAYSKQEMVRFRSTHGCTHWWFYQSIGSKGCTKKWQVVLGGESQRASKCGKRRQTVLGSMVLANKTKRCPQWTGCDAGSLCELFSSHIGAGPNV